MAKKSSYADQVSAAMDVAAEDYLRRPPPGPYAGGYVTDPGMGQASVDPMVSGAIGLSLPPVVKPYLGQPVPRQGNPETTKMLKEQGLWNAPERGQRLGSYAQRVGQDLTLKPGQLEVPKNPLASSEPGQAPVRAMPEGEPPPFQAQMISAGGSVPAREARTMGPMQQGALQAGFGVREQSLGRQGGRAQEALRGQLAEVQQITELEKEGMHSLEMRRERQQQEQMQHEQAYLRAVESVTQGEIDREKVAQGDVGAVGAIFKGLAMGLPSIFGGMGKEVDKRIERDIAAQRFMYQSGMDKLKGLQTAYGMAADRWGNEMAAEHFARAVKQGYADAKLRELKVKYAGTQYENEIDEKIAEIGQMRFNTIAAGLKYQPASYVEPRYAVSVGGQAVPFALTRGEALGLYKENTGPEADLKRAQAAKATGEVGLEGQKFISTQVDRAKVPEIAQMIKEAQDGLTNSPVSWSEKWLYPTPEGPMGRKVHKRLYGSEAAGREQAWHTFYNNIVSKLAGANVPVDERKRMDAALEGAGDTEARLNALRMAEESLNRVVANAEAGGGPAGTARYRAQGGAAERPSAPADTIMPGK